MQALDEASPRPLCIRRHLFARRDAHGASAPVPLVLRAGPVASLRRGEAGTRGAGPGAGRRAGRAQSPRCGRAAHVRASTAHPPSGAACSEVKDPAETPQVRSGYSPLRVSAAGAADAQRLIKSVDLRTEHGKRHAETTPRRTVPAGPPPTVRQQLPGRGPSRADGAPNERESGARGARRSLRHSLPGNREQEPRL